MVESSETELREISLVQLFKREAESVTASVVISGDKNSLAFEISSFCRSKGITILPANLNHDNSWEDLPIRLSATGIQLTDDISRESLETNKASLNAASFGIADTGTLVFFETSSADVRPGTIPVYHLVLLRSADIHLQAKSITSEIDRFVLECLTNRMPCRVSMVSGPSRTADIERELTVGVHGPKELAIFILDEPGS